MWAKVSKERKKCDFLGRTHCLLLQENLPELWILGCLRCLAPGKNDERYLVSKPATANQQWALRYTSTAKREDVLHKCSSSCGIVLWGSEIHCLVARLYNFTQAETSHSASFAGFDYFELRVEHMKSNMQMCSSCVRSNIDSHFENTEENKTHSSIFTKFLQQEDRKMPTDLSNFSRRLFSDPLQFEKSSVSASEKGWTTQYHCVHQVADFCSQNKYRSALDRAASIMNH
uniref:AlNc14C164G7840 protein n=1 Tax=Albugo laibachii Nc14 TaxID=890382 RepID=F0WN04_9STRA|nr:AlNc14C164G7840 [Albugo laibachii Nc14]|eukprot:CCA22691.1 AlNc14C164G7840 [Albugo laibachii Nc14]